MRISDACTLLDDTLCIAAMYRCILRMLYRLRRDNQRWRRYAAMLINENRWRAQRYGTDEGLVDFGKGRIVPMRDLIEELVDLLAEDAAFFGCSMELEHARTILDRGTSAHRQLAVYNAAIEAGLEPRAALQRVVDRLIDETTTF
jgi:carboxylate-amine ligase